MRDNCSKIIIEKGQNHVGPLRQGKEFAHYPGVQKEVANQDGLIWKLE